MLNLRSESVNVEDAWEFLELAYERGWTDGLPVAPPTAEKVGEMLEYLGRDPQERVGLVPPKNGVATLEKIAINCVMAGCRPEYMPVVVAGLKAMLRPEFNLNAVEATQHACEPLLVVAGPIVEEMGFNCGDGVFGGGSRANATVGRAIRLILWNIGGAIPGETAKAPLSQPGRYSFCIAENAEANPWEPLQSDYGISPGLNAVTVLGCEAPHELRLSGIPDQELSVPRMLAVIAEPLAAMGKVQNIFPTESLIILGPYTAKMFAQEGFSKADIRRALYERTHRRLAELARGWYDPAAGNPYWPRWVDQADLDAWVPTISGPEEIHILVTGGTKASAWCPQWHSSLSQCAAIEAPGPVGSGQ